MVGSTVAFAADLSNFPAPFVSKDPGASNYLVVVGAAADPADVVGAIDIAARLGGEATTKTSVPVSGSGIGVSVVNGASLDTANTKIRFGNPLSTARDTLTSDDLPVLLKSGSVTDNSGNEFKFSQYISVDSNAVNAVTYSRYKSTLDPDTIVNLSVVNTNPLFIAKVVFEKPLNVTSTAGKTISIFGNDYTLGSGTSEMSNTTVTIYGGGSEVGIDWGMGTTPSQTVTVGSTTISVTVNGISKDANNTDLTIDGVSYTNQAANSYITTASGVRIYVKSVSLYGTGGAGRVVLKVGSDKMKIVNADYVRSGTNLDIIKGTLGAVSATGTADTISQFTVAFFAPDSETNYVTAGSKYGYAVQGVNGVDPVFKTLVFRYEGLSPSLTSPNRDTITATYSGDNYATVAFTDYRGYQKTLTFASNYENSASQTYTKLMDTVPYTYSANENDSVAKYNYTVINQGGFSHILQVSDIDSTSSTKSATLRDIISGTDYKVTLADPAMTGTLVIDGKSYWVNASANVSLKIQTGSQSFDKSGNSTAPIRLFSPIKLKNGEELVLATPETVANNTYISVPGSNTISGGEGLCTVVASTNGVTANTTTCGNVQYVVWSNAANLVNVFPTGLNLTGNINSTGLLIIEEKDSANNRSTISIPVGTEVSGSTNKINVDSGVTLVSPMAITNQQTTTSYVTKNIDYYGTLITKNTDQTGTVTVSYPDDQVIGLAFLGGTDMTVSLTGGASGTCESTTPVKVMTPVAKLDSEVTSTDKSTKNIISVGGPAVNQITAQLMNLSYPSYGAASTIPQNKGIIKLVDNAFNSGKTALIVAGWNIPDTKRATTAVVTGTSMSGTLATV